jgi:endonuclease III
VTLENVRFLMVRNRLKHFRVDEKMERLIERLKVATDRTTDSDLIRHALNELAKKVLPPTK